MSVLAPAMRHSLQEFISLAAAPVKSAAAEVAKIMQAGGAIVPTRHTDRQPERRIA